MIQEIRQSISCVPPTLVPTNWLPLVCCCCTSLIHKPVNSWAPQARIWVREFVNCLSCLCVCLWRLMLFNNLKGGDDASSSANAFSIKVEFVHALPHSSAKKFCVFPTTVLAPSHLYTFLYSWNLPVIMLYEPHHSPYRQKEVCLRCKLRRTYWTIKSKRCHPTRETILVYPKVQTMKNCTMYCRSTVTMFTRTTGSIFQLYGALFLMAKESPLAAIFFGTCWQPLPRPS